MTAWAISSSLRTLALAGGAILACTVQAQTKQGSAGNRLDWKWMNEAVFDAPKLSSSAASQQRELASHIWADKLARPEVFGSGEKAASFILIGTAEDAGYRYVFSMFHRAANCENPPNGQAGADTMYAKCPLRVTLIAPDGRSRSQDFSGYCYLNLDGRHYPRADYHTEFALDHRSSTAHFRVIQQGRTVPECNRSVRLSKG